MKQDLRVDPLPTDDWDSSLSSIIDDMGGAPINVHRLMAHHPALLQAWWSFRNYGVDGGDLGRRKGELVILRTAVHMRSWYEWGAHVARAMACGLSRDEIERVKQGPADPAWPADEALLLEAVDALITDRGLSEELQARLRAYYSVQQTMDIMAIHGMYVILGNMVNTWQIDLDASVRDGLPDDVTKEAFEAEFPR